MREIRTDILIAAPPSAVWAVLTDFPSWARWNTFIPYLEGEVAANAVLSMRLELKNGRKMEFHPRVLVCRENRELRWLGTFIVAAIFAGEHFYELEEKSQGRETRFVHGEVFTGLMPEYFQSADFFDMLKDHFHQMNRELRDEVIRRGVPEAPDPVPSTGTRLGAILR